MGAVRRGIAAAFMGGWWAQGWIWASLALFFAISISMSLFGSTYFAGIRKAVGLRHRDGWGESPPAEPLSPEEIAAMLASSRSIWVTVIGIAGLVGLLWLMSFKSF